MFLFRMIFGMFSSIVGLIFLPFTLLMNHFPLVLMILGAVFLYQIFGGGDDTKKQAAPASVTRLDPAKANPSAALGVVQKVDTYEDGNSAFATDLYASMTPPEKSAYSAAFFKAMQTIPNGTPYSWQAVNIAGRLTPTRTFKNVHGKSCRDFEEVLKVHSTQQTLKGLACQDNRGGWCKLKLNATPSCNIAGAGGSGMNWRQYLPF